MHTRQEENKSVEECLGVHVFVIRFRAPQSNKYMSELELERSSVSYLPSDYW